MRSISATPATTTHRMVRQLAQLGVFTHLTSHDAVKKHNAEGFHINRYDAYTKSLAWKIISAVGAAVEYLVHLPEDQVDNIANFQNISAKSILTILTVQKVQIPSGHGNAEAFAQELSQDIVLMVRDCRKVLSALDDEKLADPAERESQLQLSLNPTDEAGSPLRLLMDSICSKSRSDGSQGVGMLSRHVRDLFFGTEDDEKVSVTWSLDSNFAFYGNPDMFGMLIPMIVAYQQAAIFYASLIDDDILSMDRESDSEYAAEVYALATGYARGIYQLAHSESLESAADVDLVRLIVDAARESTKWASECGEIDVEAEEAASNMEDDY